MLHAPDRWRATKPVFECAGKCLAGAKANRQGDIQYLCAWLRCEPHGRDLHTSPAQIISYRFTHPRGKQPMKVEWRKKGDFRQRIEVKRVIEMLINMCQHPMHSGFVF
jgi:hypothetical protein